jgi:L-fuconolactonase
MIVDAHAHVTTADVDRYPPGPIGGHELDPRHLRAPHTTEQLVQNMSPANVDRALIVQRTAVYGHDNRYVLDSADSYPELLSAVVAIDGMARDALAQVGYCIEERGAKGIRFSFPGTPEQLAAGDTSWFAGDDAKKIWRRAGELGVPACIHLMRSNRDASLGALADVADELSEVNIIVDHFGNCPVAEGAPDYGLGMLRHLDLPNVFFKLAPVNFRQFAEAGLPTAPMVRRAVDIFGAERVLYGSDVSNSPGTYDELINAGHAATSELTPDERDAVLGGTAARLYGIS